MEMTLHPFDDFKLIVSALCKDYECQKVHPCFAESHIWHMVDLHNEIMGQNNYVHNREHRDYVRLVCYKRIFEEKFPHK